MTRFLPLAFAAACASGPEGVGVGETAPDFTLPDATGQQRSLSDFRGAPVFLKFSAMW